MGVVVVFIAEVVIVVLIVASNNSGVLIVAAVAIFHMSVVDTIFSHHRIEGSRGFTCISICLTVMMFDRLRIMIMRRDSRREPAQQ